MEEDKEADKRKRTSMEASEQQMMQDLVDEAKGVVRKQNVLLMLRRAGKQPGGNDDQDERSR